MIKRIFLLVILFILILPSISAVCEEGQIDINSASVENLTKIINIGPSRAAQMITLRPFSSVDDMIRIVGISEGYIEDIKSQGLACVNGEINDTEENNDTQEPPVNDFDEDEEDDDDEETNETATETTNIPDYEEASNGEKQQPITAEIIKLNPKVIKSEDDGENGKGLSDYAIYGFVVFCILLGFLFALKKYKAKKNETEW